MIFTIFNFLLLSCSSSRTFAKPLSKQDKAKYIEAMFNGSSKARCILIERNLRLIAHIAKKYNGVGKNYNEELISIGTIRLIKGINSFKSDKNTTITWWKH